jgi:acyl-coenzyme A thioesterase PaaI-like protein
LGYEERSAHHRALDLNEKRDTAAMTKLTIAKMNRIAGEDLPGIGQTGIVFEAIEDGEVWARLPFHVDSLRPGGTVSRPTMMGLADLVMYACVLSQIGIVKMAAATNLNANFLRLPGSVDLIANGRLLKCGQGLAYGEVTITSDGVPDDVICHVTVTYSIPPR